MDSTTVSLVQTTFKIVTSAEDGPAQLTRDIFANLFAASPETRELFPASMDVSRQRLLQAIGYVVDKLDTPRRILPFLEQLGRDHRKYGVKDAHYTAVGNAVLDALQSFTGNQIWTVEVDEAWRQTIALISATMMGAANSESRPSTWTGTVVEHKQVLRDVAVVRLQLDQPMEYGAGQYVSVSVPGRPRMWRYLSPAIPSNPQGQIEFHVRQVSGGWVSPAIVGQTSPGDKWSISAPLGALGVDRTDDRDMVMIASGTGIAPLRAQLMEMAMRGSNPRVHLFVAGTYPCDLYDIETLWQLSMTNPWLTVVPVSEEAENPWWHTEPVPESPPGMHQRLIGKVGQVVSGFGTWADRDIQIVGSTSMVQTTKFRLLAAGTPAECIRYDPPS
ncbi:FAD-binding oxidoreductase [Rhodococcus kronopolitis]|uniref:nitric oxide dioxygenase n=1 Tax=Rhodococcus kronopolitis TaxID=1460226 RepID=A0ABV9FTM1_9NOCA